MSSNFPPALPHGSIHEVLPGIHFVTGQMKIGPMRFSRNMTILVDGERVVLFNSVRLNDEGLAELDALGKVTDVIRLAGHHGRDDRFYQDRYGATVHAVEGQFYFTGPDPKKGEIYFEADSFMSPGSPLPVEGELYVIDTNPCEALLLIPNNGGTFIAGDSLQNIEKPDQFFNLAAKVGMRAMGFINPCTLGAGWIKSQKPDAKQLTAILDFEFENLLPSHGTPVIGNAKERYRPAIESYAAK